VRLGAERDRPDADGVLAQRERQRLACASRGKTVADTAILVAIAPRAVVFHLDNARRKLGATLDRALHRGSVASPAIALSKLSFPPLFPTRINLPL
jgi:DNA-binding CsgD family transcriptional regulator